MRYLYRRGRGAKRRVMHMCGYDPITGEPTIAFRYVENHPDLEIRFKPHVQAT